MKRRGWAAPSRVSWLQWRTLVAAHLGWMLDGMDMMLYAFAIPALREQFGFTAAEAGAVVSLTLVTSAAGGVIAGVAADRWGRARVLAGSILLYSVCTGMAATSRSAGELTFWRAATGFGLGAEWSAGSVLVAETWPADLRARAIGFMQSGWALGYGLAAILAAVVLPQFGWRWLFAVGSVPAVLAWWIRRRIPEPEIWKPRRPDGLREALRHVPVVRLVQASILSTVVLFAYWGLFSWAPTYLSSDRQSGGAGLGALRSTVWIVALQAGAFAGYNCFGWVADRVGRRRAAIWFFVGAAGCSLTYSVAREAPWALLAVSPLLGFFGHGYFSLFGALLAELFPTAVRATAQGFCYHVGRLASAVAPAGVGYWSERFGFGPTLAGLSLLYVAAALVVSLLPETAGRELSNGGGATGLI